MPCCLGADITFTERHPDRRTCNLVTTQTVLPQHAVLLHFKCQCRLSAVSNELFARALKIKCAYGLALSLLSWVLVDPDCTGTGGKWGLGNGCHGWSAGATLVDTALSLVKIFLVSSLVSFLRYRFL
jgi:hypothetical protein